MISLPIGQIATTPSQQRKTMQTYWEWTRRKGNPRKCEAKEWGT